MRRQTSDVRPLPSSGFTLVELLVVIVIIGILATAAFIAFTGYQKRARNAIRLNDLEELRGATERYKTNREDSLAPRDDDFVEYEALVVPTYMQSIPVDPGNKSYQYARDNVTNPSDYFYAGYDEINSTPGVPVYLKKGPYSASPELNGVDGDSASTPTLGIEFGY